MVKIAHIADCHLQQSQYGSRARGRDFFLGLMSAVRTAIEQGVHAILCAGDMIDTPYPSADIIAGQLQMVHELLKEHNLPMLVINGNHDATKVPWAKTFSPGPACEYRSGIIPIDGQRYTVSGDGGACVTVDGRAYCLPADLRKAMEDAAPADILMWHGEILEFCGYPREGCIAAADFPEGKYKLIAMGDQHLHKYIRRDSDGLVIAYPGSTELCSLSESVHKMMFVYTFEQDNDAASMNLSGIESVPFKTRKVQKFSVHTQEDLERAYSELVPGALVFVEYMESVPGAMSRLNSFVETHPETILRTVIMREEQADDMGAVVENDGASMPTLRDFSWATLSETAATKSIAGLVHRLTDPATDSRAVIDEYVDNALQ